MFTRRYKFFIGPISECLLLTVLLCAVHIVVMYKMSYGQKNKWSKVSFGCASFVSIDTLSSLCSSLVSSL